MAVNAHGKVSQKAPNTLNLLQELFGSDSARHDMVNPISSRYRTFLPSKTSLFCATT